MNNKEFESRVSTAWPPEDWRGVSVLVAVSGGADSVGLLRALAALKTSAGVPLANARVPLASAAQRSAAMSASAGAGRLVVAHFNHHLRPEAGEDARFVAELAEWLGLRFELGEGRAAEAASVQGDGLEAAARAERYAFLQVAAERHGARYVVTAHTADDQAETVLHRILRGTGISGLAGMRRARPLGAAATLIRPLLQIRRAEIRDYLAAIDQPFRDDASNADEAFTRNRIRRDLLPQLADQYNPGVIGALLRLAEVARDAQQVIDDEVVRLMDRSVSPPGKPLERVIIYCGQLAGENRHLVREMFVAIWREQGWPQQAMGFAEWDTLAALALDPSTEPQSRNLPGNIRAQKAGEQLSLNRLE